MFCLVTAKTIKLVLQKNFSGPSAPFAGSFSAPEIMRRCGLAGETRCRLQVVPVNRAEEWSEIAGLSEGGADVSAEICPRYVVFNRNDAVRIRATAECAPPLRGEATWVEMVRWVRVESVDTLGTDHESGPPGQRRGGDFFDVGAG